MTDYELKVPGQLLSSLMSDKHALAELLEDILNQVLEVQVEDQLGAGRYERSAERTGYRNSYRPRALYTRVGPLTLRVPQLRNGTFSTEIFARYQRSTS